MAKVALPTNEAATKFVKVELPVLGSTYVSRNTGRTGIVREVVLKFTAAGYATMNIGFDSTDELTGEVFRQWACESPMV